MQNESARADVSHLESSILLMVEPLWVNPCVGGCNITELQYAASYLASGLAVPAACFPSHTGPALLELTSHLAVGVLPQ